MTNGDYCLVGHIDQNLIEIIIISAGKSRETLNKSKIGNNISSIGSTIANCLQSPSALTHLFFVHQLHHYSNYSPGLNSRS